MAEFRYYPPMQLGPDRTEYELLTAEHVRSETLGGRAFLAVDDEALTLLARRAFHDIAFFQRASHNAQLAEILNDVEATANDKFVALALLKNAVVASREVLPLCQDTGTATIIARKGQYVLTAADDAEALTRGVWETWATDALRHSQTAALTLYEEKNTGNNLPPQIDIAAGSGREYEFLFLAKGGGSSNKTYLFQESKALLTPKNLLPYLVEKTKGFSTAACPPNHMAVVIGGTSPEACLKTVKLAAAGYLDTLPQSGNETGQAFRDLELEEQLWRASQALGIGAQFGGKHFAHDVRVIRLPRHGASCPIGMGVSCSAHRNARAKINDQGIWLEKLDRQPARWLPANAQQEHAAAVKIDLNRPMPAILADLSKHAVKTRLALSGKVVVARDMAHAKAKERLESGRGLPDYVKDHPILYAGPARTPKGMPSGSLGPTSSSRMDSFVDLFQSHGGSMIMIGKGNRSQAVTDACKKHGGFYLGTIGGVAALLASEHVKSIRVLEYPELGMEAFFEIEVVDFPAVILVDDKGNDFFKML
ncbi:MAG: fumarate hydratase C-terminal domain-containing protein [Deltaproteobacteria bacterium]|nr:fumarate hydratase C-terminal domain-containing protein [Deltaproteobacteria bacterium]